MGSDGTLHIRLLGGVQVTHSSDPMVSVDIASGASRICVGVLALAYPQAVSSEVIADAIWGGELPDSWRSALRNTMSRLRKQLAAFGECIVGTADGYVVRFPKAVVVDALEAQTAALHLTNSSHLYAPVNEARASLQALRNVFLPGADSHWRDSVMKQMQAAYLNGLDALSRHACAQGLHEPAIDCAREAIVLDPYRESARQNLLRGLLGKGAWVDGLRAYEEWRSFIGEELGTSPSPETESVYLQLLGVEVEANRNDLHDTLLAESTISAASDSAVRDSAVRDNAVSDPAASDSAVRAVTNPWMNDTDTSSFFVGSADSRERLKATLASFRHVTVTGISGVGKTRLAAEVAASWNGPLVWVSLNGIETIAAAKSVVADAIRSQTSLAAEPSAQTNATFAEIAAAFDSHDQLIVIDDIPPSSVRSIVREVVEATSKSRILVTSRFGFELTPEHLHPLEPLSSAETSDHHVSDHCVSDHRVPTATLAATLLANEAVRLGADPTEWSAERCANLARQLDGLPLALRLAAQKSRLFTPTGLSLALDELGITFLDSADQTKTGLTGMLALTVEQLSDAAREVLTTVSIFAESFDFRAAFAVHSQSGGVLAVEASTFAGALAELMNCGLLRKVSVTTQPRFQVLRLALSTTSKQRSELQPARVSHAKYFLDQAELESVRLCSEFEAEAVEAVRTDILNYTDAVHHLLAHNQPDEALRIVTALAGFAFYRLNQTVAALALSVVEAVGVSQSEHFSEAAASGALLAWMVGDAARADRCYGWATRFRNESSSEGWWMTQATGVLALYRGDVHGALCGFRAGTEVESTHPIVQEFRAAIARSQVTLMRSLMGETDALDVAISSTEHADASGSPTAKANAAWAMGIALMDLDPDGALSYFESCRRYARAVDAHLSVGAADGPVALVRQRLGASQAERIEAVLTLGTFWRDTHQGQYWLAVEHAVVLLVELGRHRVAAILLGAAEHAPFHIPLPKRERAKLDIAKADLLAALGKSYELLTKQGKALSVARCAELMDDQLRAALEAVIEDSGQQTRAVAG